MPRWNSNIQSLFFVFSLCNIQYNYAAGPPPGYQAIPANTCKLSSQNNVRKSYF